MQGIENIIIIEDKSEELNMSPESEEELNVSEEIEEEIILVEYEDNELILVEQDDEELSSVEPDIMYLGGDVQKEVDPTVPLWAKQPNKPIYDYSEIENTPTLSSVAISGDYNDLKNQPTIPSVKGLASEDYVNNKASTTLKESKDYTDTKVANLVNSAPETLDTLGELATALKENEDVVDTLNQSITNKANKSDIPTNISQLANDSGFALEEEVLAITGDVESLETNDTSNLVNAINEIVNKGDMIQHLCNQTIDLNNIGAGLYLLLGKSTTIKRGDATLITSPVLLDTSTALLIVVKASGTNTEGMVFQPTIASPRINVYMFDQSSFRQLNFMNLLTTDNTKSYSPTSNYHPATKLYVDNKYNILNQTLGIKYLGYIDMSDYNDDVMEFMGTLTSDGTYVFTDSIDEFSWRVKVETAGNLVGQTYWNTEESYTIQYFRGGWYDEDADEYHWYEWDSYLNYSTANAMFKGKNEVDYKTVTVADLRTWLDEMKSFITREYEVIQSSNNHKFMVNVRSTAYTESGKRKYVKYQEYYDIEEPNKIYRRTGTASSSSSDALIIWGKWYVFEGTPE